MRQTYSMDDVHIDRSVATQHVVVVDYLAVSVIHNLVTNAHNAARRAGQKPSVHVSVSPLGTDRVAIEVLDSGPGIPQSVQNQLFRSAVGSAEGSGIGLLMGRYLVELWGGTLELMHSLPGDTLFRATFPKDAVVDAVALLEVPQHATP
jgi:two-component system, NtrC family, C4-dicarboxylate transport sensor histidine kinase DctB